MTPSWNPRGLTVVARLFLAGSLCSPALASVTFNINGSTLTVTSDGADFISITQVGVELAVNGTTVPASDSIQALVVNGGSGDNNIDLSQVSLGNFSVTIDGGGGSDAIFGSQLDDTVIDDDGGDTLNDSPGDDTYIVRTSQGSGHTTLSGIGQGNDTLIVEGTSAGDMFVASSTQTTVGGRSVSYDGAIVQLTLRGGDGDDVFAVHASRDFAIDVQGQGSSNGDLLVVDDEGGTASSDGTNVTFATLMSVTSSGVEFVSACDLAGAGDCNSNGVPDDCELSAGAATDDDANGQLDACDTAATTGDGSTGGSTTGDGSNTGISGGGTTTDGSTTGTSGGSGSGAGDAAADDLEQALGCGNGLCGAGAVPMMPLLFAGMCGMKRRLASGRWR